MHQVIILDKNDLADNLPNGFLRLPNYFIQELSCKSLNLALNIRKIEMVSSNNSKKMSISNFLYEKLSIQKANKCYKV